VPALLVRRRRRRRDAAFGARRSVGLRASSGGGCRERRDGIRQAHDQAVAAGEPGYLDPASGAFVIPQALAARGECCGSGCRHCPYPIEATWTEPDRTGDDAGYGLTDDQSRGRRRRTA
jgi:hypothetical protein